MDYRFNECTNVSYDTAREWTKQIFKAVGMNENDAFISADTLVKADARGVYSHGIMRTGIYCNRMIKGGTDPKGRPEIVKNFGATTLIDGHNAMGQVVSCFAMEHAIAEAKKFGSSTVSITGSNHLGACAYYAEMAADADMIGIVWTINCGNIMAPWGGVDPRLGNNPFAFAIPCATKPNIVLDLATSVVARGKIVMARKTNSLIPDTWALDKCGKPTTDPEAGYWGTVRPFGDHKGYGLTYINAIISALLSNSSFGETIIDLYEEPEKIQNTGHLFQVIDISAIDDAQEFKKRMDDSVDYLKAAEKAPGVNEIFVPGEIEARKYAEQLKSGISYPTEVIEENRELSKSLGIKPLV